MQWQALRLGNAGAIAALESEIQEASTKMVLFLSVSQNLNRLFFHPLLEG
ncbi:MAG: hypothetical protein ICV63_15900 [Coleofasciculus sp. Co-bin14]|nr:hypothetical protein [Coleofasciculus sp. Co-bin14]